MIELSRCRWTTRQIAGAKALPVGRNGRDGQPLPDQVPSEIRVEFNQADVATIMQAVPYPGSPEHPITAWWTVRGETWTLLVGERGKNGQPLDPEITWAWQIRGVDTLKTLSAIIPQTSMRSASVAWEKPAALDQPPRFLAMRLAGSSKDEKPLGDSLDTLDVPQLLSILVTEKIPHDRKTAKAMQKPDLMALVRKYRTPARPSLVL